MAKSETLTVKKYSEILLDILISISSDLVKIAFINVSYCSTIIYNKYYHMLVHMDMNSFHLSSLIIIRNAKTKMLIGLDTESTLSKSSLLKL